MISNAALNACLNGLSGVLLACGYAAIRAGKKGLHKAFMLSAVSVSSLFLISYLTYHIRVGKAVLFQGQGWIRPAGFRLLTSHRILAATTGRLSIGTLRRASFVRFDKRRLIAGRTP